MCLLCGGLLCTDRCTEELPDDDTHVSKHVGAAELNNKLLKNQCIRWLFINIRFLDCLTHEDRPIGSPKRRKEATNLLCVTSQKIETSAYTLAFTGWLFCN
jgi:hypothetical protein